MVDKIPWLWVIVGGSLVCAFGVSISFRDPGTWIIAGMGLALALAGAAQYAAELVRITTLHESESDKPVPPLA